MKDESFQKLGEFLAENLGKPKQMKWLFSCFDLFAGSNQQPAAVQNRTSQTASARREPS